MSPLWFGRHVALRESCVMPQHSRCATFREMGGLKLQAAETLRTRRQRCEGSDRRVRKDRRILPEFSHAFAAPRALRATSSCPLSCHEFSWPQTFETPVYRASSAQGKPEASKESKEWPTSEATTDFTTGTDGRGGRPPASSNH